MFRCINPSTSSLLLAVPGMSSSKSCVDRLVLAAIRPRRFFHRRLQDMHAQKINWSSLADPTHGSLPLRQAAKYSSSSSCKFQIYDGRMSLAALVQIVVGRHSTVSFCSHLQHTTIDPHMHDELQAGEKIHHRSSWFLRSSSTLCFASDLREREGSKKPCFS